MPMPAPKSKAERIALGRSDDHRDALHKAAGLLAGGGIVAFPGDRHPFLAASALNPEAVADLSAIDPNSIPTIAPNSSSQLLDWIPEATIVAQRFASRAWPGPLVLAFEDGYENGLFRHLPESVREWIAHEGPLRLRIPFDPAIRQVLQLLPGPLILVDSQSPVAQIPEVGLILEDGPAPPPPFGPDWTEVRFVADRWEIAKPGPIDVSVLVGLSGMILLFVCTGNTCRSPMAEALCKRKLADRIGCEVEQLETHGYRVHSAGIAADHAASVSPEAAEAVESLRGSLREHRSQPLLPELVHQADLIVAMTASHRDAILDHHPEAVDRVRLLDPSGVDIDDPIGAALHVYRKTAEAIDRFLDDLIDSLVTKRV